jgi:methionine-gamma-lyase
MKAKKPLGYSTTLLHGAHNTESNKAHVTPIYATSTFVYDTVQQTIDAFEGKTEQYIYGRWGNPTITEAEQKIALLEAYGLTDNTGNALQLKAILHASGMAAISTMLMGLLKAGDTVLTHLSLYGGTQELLDKVMPQYNITTQYMPFDNMELVQQAIQQYQPKIIYIETPANPTLQCVSLKDICTIAQQHNIIICVDNTFATPYIQQPFAFGADYVIHSTTKFLNGHGTALGGILIGKHLQNMNGWLTKQHRLMGGNSNAFDAYLLLNGIKTLDMRMDRHCSNALALAEYLQQHPKVNAINYLGLPQHPHYTLAMQQMKNGGAMLSFEVIGEQANAFKFIDALQICTNTVSLGTFDTLVCHPATTTHKGVSEAHRLQSGISNTLIRVSVGLESIADLISDFEQALAVI